VVILTLLKVNPGKEPQYPLNRRLVDSKIRTGRFGGEENLSPTGIRILDTQVLIPTNILTEASKFCRLLFSKNFQTSYIDNLKSLHQYSLCMRLKTMFGSKTVRIHDGDPVRISYIKMNVFVCLYICTVYKSTFLNQTLHTSPPWSGRDRAVCMGPQYFTFPTFSTYFVGSGCRFVRSRWLPLHRHCVISVTRRVLV